MKSHANNNGNNIEMWGLQGGDHTQTNTEFDITQSLWDVDQIDGDLLAILGGQTPTRDCTDLDCDFLDVGEKSNSMLEEYRDSSQMKRRRMLQFTSDVDDTYLTIQKIASELLNSKVGEESLVGDGMENIQWDSQWNPGILDNKYSGNESLNQPSEGWTENFSNDSDMHMQISPDEMNCNVTLDDQINIPEFCNILPEMVTDVVKETPAPTPCKILKGRKSHIRTPMKLTTTVAYPFTLIKPCGVQGDLTLKDINQWIHAPIQSRLKNKKHEEPSSNCPISAFTGKPVVVKTKIHTEGGKGSITIVRTKG